MLLVPRCPDADIVYSSMRERGGGCAETFRGSSLPPGGQRKHKECSQHAGGQREGRKPDEGKVAKDLASLCCKVVGDDAFVSLLASCGNLSGCQLLRKCDSVWSHHSKTALPAAWAPRLYLHEACCMAGMSPCLRSECVFYHHSSCG